MTVNYRIGAGAPAPAPVDDVGIGLPPLGPDDPNCDLPIQGVYRAGGVANW
jgi:hypothetical protein